MEAQQSPNARTQAPGTKETPARRHQARKQHPERSTDYNHQTDWHSTRQPVVLRGHTPIRSAQRAL